MCLTWAGQVALAFCFSTWLMSLALPVSRWSRLELTVSLFSPANHVILSLHLFLSPPLADDCLSSRVTLISPCHLFPLLGLLFEASLFSKESVSAVYFCHNGGREHPVQFLLGFFCRFTVSARQHGYSFNILVTPKCIDFIHTSLCNLSIWWYYLLLFNNLTMDICGSFCIINCSCFFPYTHLC